MCTLSTPWCNRTGFIKDYGHNVRSVRRGKIKDDGHSVRSVRRGVTGLFFQNYGYNVRSVPVV